MKALILHGPFKGKEAAVGQWCNDWFTLNEYTPQPIAPNMLAFSTLGMDIIRRHKNNGTLFNEFELVPLIPRRGAYVWTFKKRLIPV